MNFDDAVKRLDPEIYRRFKTALELGKWPDGQLLSQEQKEICLQAVIMYESEHNIPEEERTGYIDRSKKKKKNTNDGADDTQTVRVLH